MTRRTVFRLCVALLLPALAFASAVVPQFARPGGVSAQTAGTTVALCGTVSAFTAPGAATTGTLTFSAPATSFTLAAGANVTGGTLATANSNVCVVGLVGANSQLVSVTITANPTTATTVNLCGIVGPFSAAGTTTGAITIGGILYPIAVGATAFTGVAVTTGANVCITATLNALGQITGGVAVTNPTTTATTGVTFCGTLSSFNPAASSATSATIVFSSPSQIFTVAPGVAVGNTTLATAGGLVCIVGQSNGTQLTSVSFLPTVSSTVTVCGLVSAYNPATTTTAGSVTINGTTLALAPNSTVSSAITVNANLCLVATLNTLQQAAALAVSVNQVVVTATPTATVTGTAATPTVTATPTTLVICGVITNYLAATASTNGTLTINGTVVGIAPGALFSGAAIGVNANVCISATLNSLQQITTAAVTLNAVTPTATVNVPAPPPPPAAATATATATAVPPTATATAVPPTATPVPPQPTNTPKPSKPAKPTATTAPPAVAPVGPGPAPAPTSVPPPAKLPSTGFGGTGALAHNAAVGRVFRAAHGNVTTPLGIASQPATGGGSDPLSPAVPAILGLAVIGFGVLARKFGIARR